MPTKKRATVRPINGDKPPAVVSLSDLDDKNPPEPFRLADGKGGFIEFPNPWDLELDDILETLNNGTERDAMEKILGPENWKKVQGLKLSLFRFNRLFELFMDHYKFSLAGVGNSGEGIASRS